MSPPRLLLLHGVGGGAAIWGPEGSNTVAELAAQAIDFPGYGARHAEAPALDAMVGAVQSAMNEAGPASRWVLVGHSMGGMVAQELLARGAAPQVVGLVLVCTSAAFGPADGAWQARFLAERLAPLDQGLGMAGMARQLVPGLVAPQAIAQAREAAMHVMAAVPEATYRHALQAIVNFDRREALADLRLPTLLVAGEHDRTAPPELMQRMAVRVPGARCEVLHGAGHIAPLEQPAAFHALLRQFMQQHFAND